MADALSLKAAVEYQIGLTDLLIHNLELELENSETEAKKLAIEKQIEEAKEKKASYEATLEKIVKAEDYNGKRDN